MVSSLALTCIHTSKQAGWQAGHPARSPLSLTAAAAAPAAAAAVDDRRSIGAHPHTLYWQHPNLPLQSALKVTGHAHTSDAGHAH